MSRTIVEPRGRERQRELDESEIPDSCRVWEGNQASSARLSPDFRAADQRERSQALAMSNAVDKLETMTSNSAVTMGISMQKRFELAHSPPSGLLLTMNVPPGVNEDNEFYIFINNNIFYIIVIIL